MISVVNIKRYYDPCLSKPPATNPETALVAIPPLTHKGGLATRGKSCIMLCK